MQAVFRGFQVRRQYQKITWSVGVLEKAILRWRMKRKGFRGLQVSQPEENEGDEAVDDFYKTSQKQAEERLERSVVRVQAMFRSKKAQQDYRRMKLAHEEAQVKSLLFLTICFNSIQICNIKKNTISHYIYIDG